MDAIHEVKENDIKLRVGIQVQNDNKSKLKSREKRISNYFTRVNDF